MMHPGRNDVMNRRRNMLFAIAAVVLAVAALIPLAQLMADNKDPYLENKQTAIAQSLERYRDWQAQKPPVQVQYVADIEEIWAIEDARTQTDAQLVSTMFNGSAELGYDAPSNTFYCTLGDTPLDDWPEIALSARGADGLQVAWIDDYSYDWCSDAIAENYRYELLAYTETEFSYIGVVFTAMPIVTVHAGTEIEFINDSPARLTVSMPGYEPIDTAALIHRRGGGFPKMIDKQSYRLELHRIGANGHDEKTVTSVLGMEPDTDWLLVANAQDISTVRNKIAWDLWNDWHEGDDNIVKLEGKLVELFVDNQYRGIFQLMQRIKEEEAIVTVGGNPATDTVIKMISTYNPTRRPIIRSGSPDVPYTLEYRYHPRGDVDKAFALAQDYFALSHTDSALQLDDEAFTKLVLERIDIESMVEYILFFHCCTLRDNSINNIYLFMLEQEDGRNVIYHSPWDMDTAFWTLPEGQDEGWGYQPDFSMALPTRILDLNIGNSREILWRIWREKQQTVLSDDALYQRFADLDDYMQRSGAYTRESNKHYGGTKTLSVLEMLYYVSQSINTVGLHLEERWPIDGPMLH